MSAFFLFFFNDTATTEIYTLSLHDALPIYLPRQDHQVERREDRRREPWGVPARPGDPGRPPLRRKIDRKSTRLNSSHDQISYAVFCLKKKKNKLVYESDVTESLIRRLYRRA